MKKCLIAAIGIFLLSRPAFADSSQEYMDKRLKESMTVTGHLFPNARKHPQRVITRVDECNKNDVWFQSGFDRQDVLHTRLEKGKKRCEVVIHEMLRRDHQFSFSFDVMVEDTNRSTSDQWFMIAQVHSKPGKGESWRCPVLSFESHQGKFRMYNRWDTNKYSITYPGRTCAQPGTSIGSRTMFEGYDYEPDTWYNIEISGKFSFIDEHACLTVYINGEMVGLECGYNTFNDFFHMFVKLGIYKPTTWRILDQIKIRYNDIKFHQE